MKKIWDILHFQSTPRKDFQNINWLSGFAQSHQSVGHAGLAKFVDIAAGSYLRLPI